jgi:iron(III) transport system permease protein
MTVERTVPLPAIHKSRWSGFQVRQWLRRPENILMFAISLGISLALLCPLAVVVLKSFQVQTGFDASEFSLANYATLGSPRTIQAVQNSFVIAIASAMLSGILGVTLAWINARTNVPFRGALHSLTLIPFFISPLVGSFAWSLLGSPRVGLLNDALMSALGLSEAPFNIYTLSGIIWVEGLFHVPFVYLFCIGPLRNMDPALEEAARLSGSSRFGTTFRVTLPLAAPALLSAVILSFVLVIEELGAPLVLGAPYRILTVSLLIFEGMDRYPVNYNLGSALGILLVCITGVAILIQRQIMKSRSFATVTGRGYRPTMINLGWGRYVAFGISLAYVLLAVVLPILTLVIVSFQRAWLGHVNLDQLSTQYYGYLFTDNPLAARGLFNSIFLSGAGATIAILMAIVISYVIHRTQSWGRGWLDLITTMPIGISGLVMAIGLLVVFIQTPIYGTLWILLAAYVIRYFTYGQRSVSGALISVSRDLEESSRTSGASWFSTVRRILVPLVAPGLIGGWILLFITFMREASMSLLLSKSGTETLSVTLFSLLTNDTIGAVAAYTVVQVAIILVLVAIFLRITGKDGVRI